MGTLALIFFIAAAVLFLVATVGITISGRLNLVAGGLFFGLLGILIERIP